MSPAALRAHVRDGARLWCDVEDVHGAYGVAELVAFLRRQRMVLLPGWYHTSLYDPLRLSYHGGWRYTRGVYVYTPSGPRQVGSVYVQALHQLRATVNVQALDQLRAIVEGL